MRITFPHSHAFRGGSVGVDHGGSDERDCLVEFGDGVTVIAECRAEEEAIILSVPSYRTAKNTLVTARNWRLSRNKHGLWRSEPVS